MNITAQQALLYEAAELSLQWADQYCPASEKAEAADHTNGCQPYHKAWLTLRALGILSGAGGEADFFQPALREVIQNNSPEKILITGAADFALLQQVEQALNAEQREAQITVWDICETPLKINQWYADRKGISICCEKADLREVNSNDTFDLIITHSILSFIPHEEHTTLLQKWRKWLKPNGHVVFIQAARPDAKNKVRRFSADETNAYLTKTQQAFEKQPLPFMDEARCNQLTQDFAHHRKAYILSDIEGFKQQILQSGFQLKQFDLVPRDKIGYQSANPTAQTDLVSIRLIAQAV